MPKKRKTELDKFKKHMSNKYIKKYMILLDDMESEEFCLNFHKSFEYIMPKLARTEYNSGEEKDLTININYKKSMADEEAEQDIQKEEKKD